MTKAAAIDLSPYGIRVNSVHPGPVNTGMVREAQLPKLNFSAFPSLPMSRLAEPHELAGIRAFLASGEASFCTGGSFVVDGGVSAA